MPKPKGDDNDHNVKFTSSYKRKREKSLIPSATNKKYKKNDGTLQTKSLHTQIEELRQKELQNQNSKKKVSQNKKEATKADIKDENSQQQEQQQMQQSKKPSRQISKKKGGKADAQNSNSSRSKSQKQKKKKDSEYEEKKNEDQSDKDSEAEQNNIDAPECKKLKKKKIKQKKRKARTSKTINKIYKKNMKLAGQSQNKRSSSLDDQGQHNAAQEVQRSQNCSNSSQNAENAAEQEEVISEQAFSEEQEAPAEDQIILGENSSNLSVDNQENDDLFIDELIQQQEHSQQYEPAQANNNLNDVDMQLEQDEVQVLSVQYIPKVLQIEIDIAADEMNMLKLKREMDSEQRNQFEKDSEREELKKDSEQINELEKDPEQQLLNNIEEVAQDIGNQNVLMMDEGQQQIGHEIDPNDLINVRQQPENLPQFLNQTYFKTTRVEQSSQTEEESEDKLQSRQFKRVRKPKPTTKKICAEKVHPIDEEIKKDPEQQNQLIGIKKEWNYITEFPTSQMFQEHSKYFKDISKENNLANKEAVEEVKELSRSKLLKQFGVLKDYKGFTDDTRLEPLTVPFQEVVAKINFLIQYPQVNPGHPLLGAAFEFLKYDDKDDLNKPKVWDSYLVLGFYVENQQLILSRYSRKKLKQAAYALFKDVLPKVVDQYCEHCGVNVTTKISRHLVSHVFISAEWMDCSLDKSVYRPPDVRFEKDSEYDKFYQENKQYGRGFIVCPLCECLTHDVFWKQHVGTCTHRLKFRKGYPVFIRGYEFIDLLNYSGKRIIQGIINLEAMAPVPRQNLPQKAQLKKTERWMEMYEVLEKAKLAKIKRADMIVIMNRKGPRSDYYTQLTKLKVEDLNQLPDNSNRDSFYYFLQLHPSLQLIQKNVKSERQIKKIKRDSEVEEEKKKDPEVEEEKKKDSEQIQNIKKKTLRIMKADPDGAGKNENGKQMKQLKVNQKAQNSGVKQAGDQNHLKQEDEKDSEVEIIIRDSEQQLVQGDPEQQQYNIDQWLLENSKYLRAFVRKFWSLKDVTFEHTLIPENETLQDRGFTEELVTGLAKEVVLNCDFYKLVSFAPMKPQDPAQKMCYWNKPHAINVKDEDAQSMTFESHNWIMESVTSKVKYTQKLISILRSTLAAVLSIVIHLDALDKSTTKAIQQAFFSNLLRDSEYEENKKDPEREKFQGSCQLKHHLGFLPCLKWATDGQLLVRREFVYTFKEQKGTKLKQKIANMLFLHSEYAAAVEVVDVMAFRSGHKMTLVQKLYIPFCFGLVRFWDRLSDDLFLYTQLEFLKLILLPFSLKHQNASNGQIRQEQYLTLDTDRLGETFICLDNNRIKFHHPANLLHSESLPDIRKVFELVYVIMGMGRHTDFEQAMEKWEITRTPLLEKAMRELDLKPEHIPTKDDQGLEKRMEKLLMIVNKEIIQLENGGIRLKDEALKSLLKLSKCEQGQALFCI